MNLFNFQNEYLDLIIICNNLDNNNSLKNTINFNQETALIFFKFLLLFF